MIIEKRIRVTVGHKPPSVWREAHSMAERLEVDGYKARFSTKQT